MIGDRYLQQSCRAVDGGAKVVLVALERGPAVNRAADVEGIGLIPGGVAQPVMDRKRGEQSFFRSRKGGTEAIAHRLEDMSPELNHGRPNETVMTLHLKGHAFPLCFPAAA